MKKFFSLIMALSMVLALAVPAFATDNAFAAENNKLQQNMSIKATTAEITIKLSLPTLGENPVVVNPYKLSFNSKLNGSDMSAASTDQIISPVFNIRNATNCELSADVTVTTTVGGNMTLATAPQATGDDAAAKAKALAAITKNSAYIEFRTAQTAANAVVTALPAQAAANSDAGTPANYFALKNGAVTVKKIATLAPVTTADTYNYLGFGFTGDAATQPTTAWTKSDTVTVAVAWTFTPQVAIPTA